MRFEIARGVGQVVGAMTRAATDGLARTARRSGRRLEPARRDVARRRRSPGGGSRYAPRVNGRPDPGEIVWAWVPYEEDPARGKDRPVLVLEVSGATVRALQMTSRDHDRDAEQEARAGRYWMDIGPGEWDPQGRASEVRLNRLLTLDAAAVRREGAALDRALFERVVAASRRHL